MAKKFKSAEEELATWGALKSNDPTAIEAAKRKIEEMGLDITRTTPEPSKDISTKQISIEDAKKQLAAREALIAQTGQISQTPTTETPITQTPTIQTPTPKGFINYLKTGEAEGTAPTIAGTEVPTILKSGIGKISQASLFGFNPLPYFTAKIKQEQQDKITVAYGSVRKSTMGMKADINIVKKGGDGAMEAWQDFQNQLTAVNEVEAKIKQETATDLDLFLSVDGSVELGNIAAWKQQILPGLILRMQDAINNPNPNAPDMPVDLSDFGIVEGAV